MGGGERVNETATDSVGFWAVVEIMGHQKYAGFCTETTLAGAPLLRVDVPQIEGKQYSSQQYNYEVKCYETRTYQEPDIEGYTKYFGPSSIFCVTPCTEAAAREAAKQWRSAPIQQVRLPDFDTTARLIAAAPVGAEEESDLFSEESGDLWEEGA